VAARIGVEDLASHLRDPVGEPALTLVDLTETWRLPRFLAGEAAEAARSSRRLLVGVGDPDRGWGALLEELTCTIGAGGGPVDPRIIRTPSVPDALAALTESVEAAPEAAAAVTWLLRTGGALGIGDALVTEALAHAALRAAPAHVTWLAGRSRVPPRAQADPVVYADRIGDRLMITLNRPQHGNALDAPLRDALIAHLTEAVRDESVRSVVLAGTGPSFSASAESPADATSAPLLRPEQRPGALLYRCTQRLGPEVVARVHGSVLGAGLELAAFAGWVVADPDTTFALSGITAGLGPGAGGSVSIPARAGRWRAAYLALTGTRIDARTAHAWGLVDEISPLNP
jgi:hypothetical protein